VPSAFPTPSEDAKRKRETGDVTDEPATEEPAAKVAAVETAPAAPEAAEETAPSKVPAAAGDDVPKGTPTPVLGDHVVVAVDVA
jgi:hypothetical protein